MSNPTPASPAGTYILLLSFRTFTLLGGILFSLPLRSPTSLILHTITLLLLAAECLAAQRSMAASNLRQKQSWTTASLTLYVASLLALAGCFLAPREIWSPAGFPTFPHNQDPGSRILYLPDLLAAAATAAAFFTLPTRLRIRDWHSLPRRDEGLVVVGDGDAVPVATYSGDPGYHDGDEDADDGDKGAGETGGLLGATVRAQQGGWKDDDSVVTLV